MRKLFNVLVVLLLLCTGMLFAGGDQESETPTTFSDTKAPADYEGELVIWAWSESEVSNLAAAFNEVYPNVEVQFVPVGSGEYLAKIQAALVSNGDLPDVAFMEIGTRGKMIDLECWENLSAAPYNLSGGIFFENVLPTMTDPEGNIVCIERELNPSGLAFKRDLAMKYLGTDDPDEIAAMLPDWDSFIKKGAEVYEASGGKVKFLAGQDDASRILGRQYADTVFEGNTVNASAMFEHVFSILVDMRDNNITGKLGTYSPSWNASFAESDIMFYPCAPWSGQWIIKANAPDAAGNFGVTSAPGGAYSYGGTGYSIPNKSKNKELAWEFIQWHTTTQAGAQVAIDVIGAITSLKEMYADGVIPFEDPYFGGQDVNKYLIETAAPTMKIRPMSPYDPVITDIINMVFGVIENDPSVDASAAVKLAMEEISFKLPTTFTIK